MSSIIAAKTPLSCKLTYSQIPQIKTGTSLKGHYLGKKEKMGWEEGVVLLLQSMAISPSLELSTRGVTSASWQTSFSDPTLKATQTLALQGL